MKIAEIILQYIDVLIWPVVVIIIVCIFKNDLSQLFIRLKKLDLPGGFSFESFDFQIKNAKIIAERIEKEVSAKSTKQTKTITKTSDGKIINVNEMLLKRGLKTSPSGLAINYYNKIAEKDPGLALARIRMDLEIMIENLSIGFNIPINKKDTIFRATKNLFDRNAITMDQYNLMQKLLRISSAAVHGENVTSAQAKEVFEILDVLIRDFINWLDWGFQDFD